MYKISVIVPVFNVEKYIGECVESVLNQTMRDIELICIDDASTDASLDVLEQYAKNDSRMKVIAYDTNKSASQARKDGVLAAQGEYIMFMDGDDYLQVDACEKLYSIISEQRVDILHFGTNIINVGNADDRRITNLQKLLSPYPEHIRGKDVFESCFIEKKFRFSLWNKIYEAHFCKEAFQYIQEGNFPKAQDLYAFFVLCYFAKSYYGINENYYNYRFGAGITGRTDLSLGQIERFCQSVFVADAIENFIQDRKEQQYEEIAKQIRKDLLNDCVNSWFSFVADENSSQGFDILCQYWTSTELVSILCEKYFAKRKDLADKILGASAITCRKNRNIRTIGIFYYRISIGGVQRVISMLIPLYLEMGYRVILFTDEFSEGNEYDLPDTVIRVMLPSSLNLNKKEHFQRAEVFFEYIKKYNVDVMCYQAASSNLLLFDLLLLKLNNVPVIATVHEVAFQNMLTLNTEMCRRPSVFRLLDCLTVLSRVEELYWKNMGVNAVYIQNPISQELIERDLENVEKNTIVWIGRLDLRTKRCMDVIDIMKDVVPEVPDAKLLVVGNEVTNGIMKMMEKKICKNGLEENVVLCGHSTNVDEYYRRAEVHMITSISETFPMAIAESKSYGIPLVMYDLPFIEFCRDNKGFLSAPQGNTKKMAEHIVKILKNDDLKKKLQVDAHDSLKPFMEFDLKTAWVNLFSNIGNPPSFNPDENLQIMLQSLLQHYEYGVMINSQNHRALKKNNSNLKKKLEKIQKSWAYKVGKVIIFIPKKFIIFFKKVENEN